MASPVTKHSYISGGAKGRARGVAHINYLAGRPGEDKEDNESRRFFDQERDGIEREEVQEFFREESPGNRVAMHKFIISPGERGVDTREFTRETMRRIGSEKGLDLEWRGVVHNNTNHSHAHVIVMGKDENGRDVKFDRNDYDRMREIGSEFIGRELNIERIVDRDWQRDNGGYEQERSGDLGSLLYGISNEEGRDKEKKRDRDFEFDQSLRDREIWERELRNMFGDQNIDPERFGSTGPGADSDFKKGYRQIIREQQGALGDFHELWTSNQRRENEEIYAMHKPDLERESAEHEKTLDDIVNEGPEWEPERGFSDLFGFRQDGAERVPEADELESSSTEVQSDEFLENVPDPSNESNALDDIDPPESDFGSPEEAQNIPDELDLDLPDESGWSIEADRQSNIGMSDFGGSDQGGKDDSDNLFSQGGF